MNIFAKNDVKNGFSLLDVVVSITLVGCFITGLVIAWEFSENQERGLEGYWDAKQEIETAYEITHRYLRKYAKTDIQIRSGSIRFTGTDNQTWSFYQENDSYKMAHQNNIDVLIATRCVTTDFVLNGAQVTIHLETQASPNWQRDSANLSVSGKVFLRNLQ